MPPNHGSRDFLYLSTRHRLETPAAFLRAVLLKNFCVCYPRLAGLFSKRLGLDEPQQMVRATGSCVWMPIMPGLGPN